VKTTITIRKGARIFVVEDNAERISWFSMNLLHSTVWFEKDPEKAVEWLEANPPETLDAIFLDFDLGPGNVKNSTINSLPVVDFLKSKLSTRQQRNVVIHSQNNFGAFMINTMLPGAAQLPFGDFDIEEVDSASGKS
jgi:CheY-like chemotaxis protein